MSFQISGQTTKISSIGTTPITKPIANIDNLSEQIRIMAVDVNIVVKLGDDSVTASNTYTSDALPQGNFVILAGAIEVFNVPTDATHISCVCEDGVSSGGTVWVNAGYGE